MIGLACEWNKYDRILKTKLDGAIYVLEEWGADGQFFFPSHAMNIAVSLGTLEIVKWLHYHREFIDGKDYSPWVFFWAGAHGKGKIIEWLKEQDPEKHSLYLQLIINNLGHS